MCSIRKRLRSQKYMQRNPVKQGWPAFIFQNAQISSVCPRFLRPSITKFPEIRLADFYGVRVAVCQRPVGRSEQ